MVDPPEPFTIRRERDGRLRRLIPVGDLDIATAPILQQAYDDAEADADPDTVMVVDLRELEFIDSSGIRVLLAIAEHAPGRLRVINGSASVERLFDLTGVRALLPIISPDADPLAPLR
jgi:anti-sigma B factor antagonist